MFLAERLRATTGPATNKAKKMAAQTAQHDLGD
jgi:hypothetical protein